MIIKDQTTMKFFIFTCLLAVALAQHESASIYQEKFKPNNNMVFQISQETANKIDTMESTSISQEDSINMKFFIFTCLLAIALAKHHMEHHSSREQPSSSSSSEEIKRTVYQKHYVKQLTNFSYK
ncbi:alpha-S2-casein [Macaca nemestrina]|uniref:alpha-S2-casein n=1 Tax=Macaca nemestrina TaxID=9545 RepID=UPI0039B871A5